MRLAIALAAMLSLPATTARAEEAAEPGLTLSASVTLASRYVSRGIEYSEGPVFQPYVELGYGGFYAGIWATSASPDLLGNDSEVDYYLGYRGEAGAFYYDVGYAYYTYPGVSEFNSGEVLLSGGAGLSEQLFVTASFAYAHEAKVLTSELSVDYYTSVEGLALNAAYGKVSDGGQTYWSAGGSYALDEVLTVDLAYTDTDVTDGLFVLGLTTTFNIR